MRDVDEAGQGEAIGSVGAATQSETSKKLLIKEYLIVRTNLIASCRNR